MNKLYFIFTACIVSITLLAQEDPNAPLTNKKGIPIYPQTGDWAIGINSTPFFQYIGNFFSGNNNYRPEFGFTANNPGSIYGKYVLSSKTRIRGMLNIGVSVESDKLNNPADPNNPHRITTSGVSVGIGAGIEKTRNIYGRFSGIYGAQLGIMLDAYEDPTGYFGRAFYKDANNSDNDWVEKGGRTHGLGIGGFVGVEFFPAPKVSLTGEFNLDIVGSITTDRVRKPSIGDETTVDLGGSSFSFSPVASGDLVLIFYF
jgi:hypothetical protein